MTKDKIQQELDERFLLILPVLTALVGALFLIITMRDLTIAVEDARVYFVTADVIVAALALGLWIALLRWSPPARLAHPLGMLVFFCLVAKNLLMVYLTSDVTFATQTAVAVLAVGCVLLSVRWFVIVITAILIAWLTVAFLALEGSQIPAAGAPLVIGLILSAILLRNRIRFHTTQILLEQRVEMLERLLPICATCKKVRTDDGEWAQIENYLADELERAVAHTYCPDCQAADTATHAAKGQSSQ